MSINVADSKNVYTIAAGQSFADTLAAALLAECGDDPAALARYRLLLPTRRACRNMRETFLRRSQGRPLLLPRLQTLGDVDEDELGLDLAAEGMADDILNMPPALPPLQRQILLARLVMQLPAYNDAPDQAMKLAAALGRLMDQIYTENKDLADLAGLVPDDYAAHWQITLEFLKILSQSWPEILAARGVIDAADRRNRLMGLLAAHWRAQPPPYPVVAAGSTGSIPATAALLDVIACLPGGRVILPGLDRAMDDESWAGLDDTHPQAPLRHILDYLEVSRHDVRDFAAPAPLPDTAGQPPGVRAQKQKARRWLAREMMRPACTAERWTDLQDGPPADAALNPALSLDGIKRFDCRTQREEAQLIALVLREALEIQGRRAALITPDRALARRVATACQRWGIEIDDSAGQALGDTVAGSYFRLAAACAAEDLRPAALLALLRHKFCFAPAADSALLEMALLRGPAPPGGLAGLYDRLHELPESHKKADSLRAFLDDLSPRLEPFLALCADQARHSFTDLLDAHLAMAEALAAPDVLWRDDDGEQAAQFFASLYDQAAPLPAMTARQYLALLEELMKSQIVRPSYGMHPRLAILGQLEARLVQADLVILGSLNEGSWPPEAPADPWMSRPMRAAYGLPSPERGIGLAAHDFVQGFCCPELVLTRAARVDGTPAVPARWLQRLDTVLQALAIDPQSLCPHQYLRDVALLDSPPGPPEPALRPEPAPPVAVRPDTLHVTAIERWMRDPYAFYARYILRLYPLDDLEKQAEAAQRGDFLHKALEEFIRRYPDKMPPDAYEQLLEIGRATFGAQLEQPRLWAFWWPRFERLAGWFTEHEQQWRARYKPALTESEGQAQLPLAKGGVFTIKAKADRIDRDVSGGSESSAALIDYKTGGIPAKGDIQNGYAPQMPLEALILEEGGFAGIPAGTVSYLGFWHLTGGTEPGAEKPVTNDPAALAEMTAQARSGLIRLAEAFADECTPYYSLPRPDKAPPKKWQDYAHLARVQEWTALGDDNENEEAA